MDYITMAIVALGTFILGLIIPVYRKTKEVKNTPVQTDGEILYSAYVTALANAASKKSSKSEISELIAAYEKLKNYII